MNFPMIAGQTGYNNPIRSFNAGSIAGFGNMVPNSAIKAVTQPTPSPLQINGVGGVGTASGPNVSGFGGTGGGTNGQGGNQWSTGLGFNVGTGQLLLGGLQAIGNFYAASQANKLAREQFAFQKDVTEANLGNQIKAYNTTLQDRTRSRAHTESGQAGGMTQEAAQQYIKDHSLQRRQAG